ncbi:MAG: nitroreductase/quinone reductase family protein [Chloroflexi bacterium OHK40]
MQDHAAWWRRIWTPFFASAPGRAFIRYVAQPADRLLLPLTRGRFTLSRLVYPTLLLTTIGAKSGRPRATPLIYFRDGPRIVLVASNYGGARHPAWYHNLRTTPRATVTLEGATRPYLAHEASGAERAELWRKAVAFYGGYATYQRCAGPRQIPIMVLEPAPEHSAPA